MNCNRNRRRFGCKFLIRAAEGPGSTDSGRNVEDDKMLVVNSGTGGLASKDYIGKMREMISSSPPGVFLVNIYCFSYRLGVFDSSLYFLCIRE